MDIESKKKDIKQLITSNRVVLFMKGTKEAPQCGFSAQVVHLLNDLRTDYITQDVLADPLLREAIKAFSDWPTVPQLYVDGEFIGGCDITLELAQSGELQSLLQA